MSFNILAYLFRNLAIGNEIKLLIFIVIPFLLQKIIIIISFPDYGCYV